MPKWEILSSHVCLYYWAEHREAIKTLSKRSELLDLVILPGVHRTGTSVLYQCLAATKGFKERYPLKLLGQPATEHRLWKIANYVLGKYLGATAFLPGSERDEFMGDLLIGKVNHSKPLTKAIKEEMDDLVGVLVWQDAKLLKEPTCQLSLKTWIDNYDCFKNARYIWTRRDVLETAKSLVRLKVPDRRNCRGGVCPTGYRGKLTVKKAESLVWEWDEMLRKVMPQVNHIEIWHHNLINHPEKTFKKISEFVGRRVNTTPFDMGKVYAAKKH